MVSGGYGVPRVSVEFARKYFILNSMLDICVAEVGVYKGDNAESMIKILEPQKIYLVDPYLDLIDDNGNPDEYEKFKQPCVDRLSVYKNISWIFKKSNLAVEDVQEQLDFVYIDGDHHHWNVISDIALWYPKVKVGGILAGHDFGVDNVSKPVRMLLSEIQNDEQDWWIIKKDDKI